MGSSQNALREEGCPERLAECQFRIDIVGQLILTLASHMNDSIGWAQRLRRRVVLFCCAIVGMAPVAIYAGGEVSDVVLTEIASIISSFEDKNGTSLLQDPIDSPQGILQQEMFTRGWQGYPQLLDVKAIDDEGRESSAKSINLMISNLQGKPEVADYVMAEPGLHFLHLKNIDRPFLLKFSLAFHPNWNLFFLPISNGGLREISKTIEEGEISFFSIGRWKSLFKTFRATGFISSCPTLETHSDSVDKVTWARCLMESENWTVVVRPTITPIRSPNLFHWILDFHQNGWWIDLNIVKVLGDHWEDYVLAQDDGRFEMFLMIEYASRRGFALGQAISAATLGGIVLVTVIVFIRRRYKVG